MRDLYRCLDEYPPELLQALAQSWDIELPRDEPLRTVLRVGEGMLRDGAIQAVVESLSPGAREALAEVVALGGATAARNLSLRHGEIRRFGPAALRREQPWIAPASPLEELYYRGLLYRTFGELQGSLGELLIIPDQLLERMPPIERHTLRDELQPVSWKQPASDVGAALAEDLLAEIVALRRQPIRLPADVALVPELQARLDLGQRLMGPADALRLHLLWRLLIAQNLIEHDGRQWRVAQHARHWLGASDAEQQLACYQAWRGDRSWSELYDLPDLICDRATCPHDAAGARARFCSVLQELPPGEWFNIEAFLAGLKRHHPDYLRPDGDLDGWFVRSRATGGFLRGMDAWEAIEGALAAHYIAGPLYWLGVVALADSEAGKLFLITSTGREMLDDLPPHLNDTGAQAPPGTLDSRLRVTVSMRNSRYQRYQLERLAQWQGQDQDTAHYWLSENAVWEAQNAGITTDQILSFLRRITGGKIPEIAVRTLQAWGQRFGRAALSHVVLLETRDAPTMQLIRQIPSVAALLGEPLGPMRCLVPEENMERLVQELKKRNIWPRIVH